MISHQPVRLTASAATSAALSLVLAAAVLAAAFPAHAADDEVPLDSKILRGIMEAIGLRKDGEAIVYQERAPLVIPPSRMLPPPEKSGAVIANNPAWPKDPDVQRAKEEVARLRDKAGSAEEQISSVDHRLTEAELTPGPKPRTARRSTGAPSSPSADWNFSGRLTSAELGYKGGLFNKMFGGNKDDVARFTGEPPRTVLTEPPPGYQTPSPDQPYGLGAKAWAPKPTDYLTEHGMHK